MTAAARRWTPSEISLYEERRAQKVDNKTIAAELGRSLTSVVMRGQRGSVRASQKRIRELYETRISLEPQFVVPPAYVKRERSIRLSIPPISTTQVVLADPVEGYSALDSKRRHISVQDALEICALHTGRRGEKYALASTYAVSVRTIEVILSGEFFERLLKPKYERPE